MSSPYKRKGGPKHVRLYEWMMRSPAWASLDSDSRLAYVELKRRYDGFNNGRIGLGCRELAAALNVSKNSANRALAKLQDRGFVVITKRSGFNRKDRVATEWLITDEKNDLTGEPAGKDFMHWGKG